MIARLAEPNDAADIGVIRVSAWREAYKDIMPHDFLESLDETENLDELKKKLSERSDDFVVYVAEDDGLCTGFSILGRPRYHSRSGTIELWALNVKPDHWRMGVGKSLLKKNILHAKTLNANEIELWCLSENIRAKNFYKELGFVSSGRSRTTDSLTGLPLNEISMKYTL